MSILNVNIKPADTVTSFLGFDDDTIAQSVVLELHPDDVLIAGLENTNNEDRTLEDPMIVIKYALKNYLGYVVDNPYGQVMLKEGLTDTFFDALDISGPSKYVIAANILNYVLSNYEAYRITPSAHELGEQTLMFYDTTLRDFKVSAFHDEASYITKL